MMNITSAINSVIASIDWVDLKSASENSLSKQVFGLFSYISLYLIIFEKCPARNCNGQKTNNMVEIKKYFF